MARTLTYEGTTVPFHQVSDFTMAEVIWAEKQIGSSFSDWTNGQETVVAACLSLRRANVMLTPNDILSLPFGALIDGVTTEAEPEEPEVDPQAAGAEAGLDLPSDETSTSSD